MSFTITTVTAFLGKDDKDEEGMIALTVGGIAYPCIFADEERALLLYPMIKAKFPDGTYRIVQFSERKDVTDEWLQKLSHLGL